jgi:hypothetical protein
MQKQTSKTIKKSQKAWTTELQKTFEEAGHILGVSNSGQYSRYLAGTRSCEQWAFVGFEVFTALVMKSIIWDVTPCSLLKCKLLATCLLAGSC